MELPEQSMVSRLDRFKKDVGVHWLLIGFTNFFAFIFGLIILCLCWKFAIQSARQPHEFILVSLLGALMGWTFGMFFVPYGPEDKKRFSNVTGALSAFVSGYVLSAADDFFKKMLTRLDGASETVWVMLGLFFCSALLVFLVVFSNRSYHGKKG